LESWERSEDAADRCFVARVIGKVALTHVYQPLLALLVDSEVDVRLAALSAAGKVKHPRLLKLVVQNLGEVRTRSAASDALVLYGDAVLPVVEQALSGELASEAEVVRLLRICGQIKGEKVKILLRRNIDHSSNVVRDQILKALSACDFQAQQADLPALNKALVRDANLGHRAIIAWQDIGESEPTEMLRQALLDERDQAIGRVFLLLSYLYGARSVLRAQSQLERGSGSQQALALEMLEVTLSAEHHALCFPLIDPKLEMEERIQLLNKRFNNETMYRDKRLPDLIRNSAEAWTRACAIYAVAKLAVVGQLAGDDMMPIIEEALGDSNPIVRETAAWGLHSLSPDRFHDHREALLADVDETVASIAAEILDL
jgi:hypothetical protein